MTHTSGPDRDGNIVVHVSEDEMLASMDLYPRQGDGKPLGLETAEYALFTAGVTNGIDRESIAEGIHRAEGSGETVKNVVAARGVAAVNTAPRRYALAFLVPSAHGQTEKKIDYRELSALHIVHRDDILARPAERREGQKGMTVRGKELPFTNAPDEELEAGENVVVRDDGAYAAAEDGRLIQEKGRIRVEIALIVQNDVDLSVGNIRFPKDVVVGGNILDDFIVETNGNLSVKGLVGAAFISAKGAIEIHGGITGKGKATVRAGGSIHTAFADNASLFCLGDLSVANEIVNSTVHSNGRITCVGKKGAIIGGAAAALNGIECSTAGSERNHATRLEAGVDVLVSSRLLKAEELIAHLAERISSTTLAIEEAKNAGRVTQDHEKEFKELVNKLNELTVEKEKLKKALYPKEAAIHVRVKVFPGVEVCIHGVEKRVTAAMGPTTFSFDAKKGQIVTDKQAPDGHLPSGALHEPRDRKT